MHRLAITPHQNDRRGHRRGSGWKRCVGVSSPGIRPVHDGWLRRGDRFGSPTANQHPCDCSQRDRPAGSRTHRQPSTARRPRRGVRGAGRIQSKASARFWVRALGSKALKSVASWCGQLVAVVAPDWHRARLTVLFTAGPPTPTLPPGPASAAALATGGRELRAALMSRRLPAAGSLLKTGRSPCPPQAGDTSDVPWRTRVAQWAGPCCTTRPRRKQPTSRST